MTPLEEFDASLPAELQAKPVSELPGWVRDVIAFDQHVEANFERYYTPGNHMPLHTSEDYELFRMCRHVGEPGNA